MEVEVHAHDDSISLYEDRQGKLRLVFTNDSLIVLTWNLSEVDYKSLVDSGGRAMSRLVLDRNDESSYAHVQIKVKAVSDTFVKVKMDGHVGDFDEINANVEAAYHLQNDEWYLILDTIISHFRDKTV